MKRLERMSIVVEPRTVYSSTVSRDVIRDVHFSIVVDGQLIQYVQLYREDVLMSHFDILFDEAKKKIKHYLIEGERV